MIKTTENNKKQSMSLYQMFIFNNVDGTDICDDEWDWATFFDCPTSFEKCKDYYDKLMLLFALNIECLNYDRDGYSTCRIGSFIFNNIQIFEQFCNEENREGYRPMDYEDTNDPESETFYEVYLSTFEALICGNYCESDYEKLYNLLTKE